MYSLCNWKGEKRTGGSEEALWHGIQNALFTPIPRLSQRWEEVFNAKLSLRIYAVPSQKYLSYTSAPMNESDPKLRV